MTGAGVRVLSSWGTHASLNLSGGIDGTSPSCGKRVQFTGNAAFYTRLTSQTDFYVAGKRDLGDGVLEHTIFLSIGGAGVRHRFSGRLNVSGSLNELYGADPISKQTYHGSFVDGSLRFRLWQGFSQETEIRRYSFSGFSQEAGRTAVVVTLWWSPPRGNEAQSVLVR